MSGNPIKLVRQSAKRERTPDILELVGLQLLFTNLSVRERTVALLDAVSGVRAVDPTSDSGQLQDGSLSQTGPNG
jgi:hypothetical protein